MTNDDRNVVWSAVFGAMVVAQVTEHRRLTGEYTDEERMDGFVEEAITVADDARRAFVKQVGA